MVTLAAPALHPADQAHADRLARAGRDYRTWYMADELFPAAAPRCDHGVPIAECLTCIQLRHAEQNSVTLRSWYAWGMVPYLAPMETGTA